MSDLLPGGQEQLYSSLMASRGEPFQVLYRLHCDNLCADFKEDLNFKFTLGISTIASKVLGLSASFFSKKKEVNCLYS